MTQARFPEHRLRRLRRTPALRRLVAETQLAPASLIAPVFVTLKKKQEPVPSMPGIHRLPIAQTVAEAKQLAKLGVGGILLFGIPAAKNPEGTGAYAANGVIPQAVKAIKKAVPELVVITDVCLCEYTSHGHCGLLGTVPRRSRGLSPWIDNDATLEILNQIALSHARAGADCVAPSAMMDGQVGAIRGTLDENGCEQVPIMSYSAKYASSLYGPFREAVDSAPQFGDRRGYQMDPPNVEEALREVALDIQEGTDIVMVKPALAYLDVVRAVKEKFKWPTACYQVSGEYALIKAASAKKWVDEKRLVMEMAVACRRAGADLIITYYAHALAQWLSERE